MSDEPCMVHVHDHKHSKFFELSFDSAMALLHENAAVAWDATEPAPALSQDAKHLLMGVWNDGTLNRHRPALGCVVAEDCIGRRWILVVDRSDLGVHWEAE